MALSIGNFGLGYQSKDARSEGEKNSAGAGRKKKGWGNLMKQVILWFVRAHVVSASIVGLSIFGSFYFYWNETRNDFRSSVETLSDVFSDNIHTLNESFSREIGSLQVSISKDITRIDGTLSELNRNFSNGNIPNVTLSIEEIKNTTEQQVDLIQEIREKSNSIANDQTHMREDIKELRNELKIFRGSRSDR